MIPSLFCIIAEYTPNTRDGQDIYFLFYIFCPSYLSEYVCITIKEIKGKVVYELLCPP